MERVSKEKGSKSKDLTEVQNSFTTKDLSASEGQAGTKSTKELENEARDPVLKAYGV